MGVLLGSHEDKIMISGKDWFHRDKLRTAETERQITCSIFMRGKLFKAKDSGQNILMSYQYNYDKMDNILNKATEHGDYAYDYDDI